MFGAAYSSRGGLMMTRFVDGLFLERPGQVGRQNFEQAGAEQELE